MVLRFDGSVTISEAQVYLGGKEKRHFVCSVPNAEGDGWDASGKRQNCYLYTAGIQWKFITALTN